MRHPFSFTLGAGPYRFVRLVVIHIGERGAQVNGETSDVKSGIGTCSHCGHAILNCYIVETGDGSKYGVGSDCIMKVHADGEFTNVSEFERVLKNERRVKAIDQRERRRQKLLDECRTLAALPELQNVGRDDRHWRGFSTFGAYAQWYLRHPRRTYNGLKIFRQKIEFAIVKATEEKSGSDRVNYAK